LAKLVQSRNKQIAMSSLVALRRFLSGVRSSPLGLAAVNLTAVDLEDPDWDDDDSPIPAVVIPHEMRATIAESVAALVVDAYVEPDVRQEAFAVARLLGGNRYAELLADLADQAELEGTQLLAQVQLERRRL
jgi:hypothetical protein